MMYNETITNAVNEAVSEFEVRVCSSTPFDKKFKLCKQMLENKMSSIYSDLYSAGRLGLISDADIASTIDEIKAFVRSNEEEFVKEWCAYEGINYDWFISKN